MTTDVSIKAIELFKVKDGLTFCNGKRVITFIDSIYLNLVLSEDVILFEGISPPFLDLIEL